MSTTSIPRALVASAFLVLSLGAQTPSHGASDLSSAGAPASVRAVASMPIDELLFDEPGDGALWVRGADYKARFDGDDATVIPFFGSNAPQNYPLALRADAAFLGGSPLALQAAKPTRDGNVVAIDRGAYVEEYELALDSLEQRFVFPRLRGAGDLVLRIAIDSELEASDLGTSLRFENDLGRIDYGAAVAFDARGQQIELESTLVDGAIQLVVPAAFVASATLPVTIDPLITFFTVSQSGRDDRVPDVAYDVTTDRWCVVWTNVWSSGDHDMFARLVSGAGVKDPAILTIDFTTELWTTGRIANNNSADDFLVCAEVIPTGSTAEVRGRFVYPGPVTVGAPFPISPLDGWARSSPDVGGNPNASTPSYFCVAWERYPGGTDMDIEMQLVGSNGGLVGGPVLLEQTARLAEHVSVSNSTGLDTWNSTPAWSVVWQERDPITAHDIWGAQVRWDGAILHPRFAIDDGPNDDTAPVVSTMLDPAPGAGERPYLVVFERQYGAEDNVAAALLRGDQVLDLKDLITTYEGAPLHADQYAPTVDSDGAQFLVGYSERTSPGSYDGNVWISNYYAWNNTLFPLATHQSLAGSPSDEREVTLTSMASSGGPRKRYFSAWAYFSPNNAYDAIGGLWGGASGGLVTGFCDGENGIPCPCGNAGVEGSGCANSASATGASLTFSGDASATADTFALHVSGLPPSTTCLFFQGTVASGGGAGVPFGDGKRCVAGAIARIGLKSGIGGSASYPELGDAAISVQGHVSYSGTTRYYQAWYRDAASFCTNETFNLTNGIAVYWAP